MIASVYVLFPSLWRHVHINKLYMMADDRIFCHLIELSFLFTTLTIARHIYTVRLIGPMYGLDTCYIKNKEQYSSSYSWFLDMRLNLKLSRSLSVCNVLLKASTSCSLKRGDVCNACNTCNAIPCIWAVSYIYFISSFEMRILLSVFTIEI